MKFLAVASYARSDNPKGSYMHVMPPVLIEAENFNQAETDFIAVLNRHPEPRVWSVWVAEAPTTFILDTSKAVGNQIELLTSYG